MVPHSAYGMQEHQTADYGCSPLSPSHSHSPIVLYALPEKAYRKQTENKLNAHQSSPRD